LPDAGKNYALSRNFAHSMPKNLLAKIYCAAPLWDVGP
jgi:hypothetical protein